MINYLDYPGTVKKEPSLAQIKQRYKFMLTGTLAGMEARLVQLRKDPMIPPGKLRARLLKIMLSVRVAREYLKDTEMQLGGE